VALTGKSLNIPDAYDLEPGVPYNLDRSFDRQFFYRTCSVLVLPMQNRETEVIGVLQLINRKTSAQARLTVDNCLGLTQAYSEWEENIVRSLASQAAISIERNLLQESIENLFEGFVKASVQVIESRDPSTFGHSERVAALTVSLGQEVNLVVGGPLNDTYFSDRQLQEMRYAALLHDFGKVGVPEAVLNKQKKLHPNQLIQIQNRFTVARQSLELERAEMRLQRVLNHFQPPLGGEHLQAQCPLCGGLDPLDQELSGAIEDLQYYWKLIIQLNEPQILERTGFQALSDDVLAQLTELTRYTYQDENHQEQHLLTQAEVNQLLVPRGNLTPEERKLIESHVVYTYEFLKQIPWTHNLREVPRIAYAHHEKLDGKGYPLGLKGNAIPIQSQILTVADIYDALTASDRPYKHRVPVDKALGILAQEAERNRINQDLVDLFKQRQVFHTLGHQL
jgi:HD-GYP domain-containing protein (c-di-GMP phosphodiesterase class II)